MRHHCSSRLVIASEQLVVVVVVVVVVIGVDVIATNTLIHNGVCPRVTGVLLNAWSVGLKRVSESLISMRQLCHVTTASHLVIGL